MMRNEMRWRRNNHNSNLNSVRLFSGISQIDKYYLNLEVQTLSFGLFAQYANY